MCISINRTNFKKSLLKVCIKKKYRGDSMQRTILAPPSPFLGESHMPIFLTLELCPRVMLTYLLSANVHLSRIVDLVSFKYISKYALWPCWLTDGKQAIHFMIVLPTGHACLLVHALIMNIIQRKPINGRFQ